MRRVIEWVAIASCILVATLESGVVSLLLAVATPWGSELARHYALAAINGRIAGHLSARHLSVSWKRVALGDLVLQDPSGAVVARVPRVVVRFALAPLVHRRVVLTDVAVVAPALRTIVAGRSSSLASAVASRRSTSPVDLELVVRRLRVRGGRVLVEEPRRRARAFVRDLRVDARGRGNPATPAWSGAVALRAKSALPPGGAIGLAARFVVAGPAIQLWASARLPGDARLDVAGAANRRRKTTSGAHLRLVHLDPARLFRRGPTGDIEADVRVGAGSLAPADLRAHAVVRGALRTARGPARFRAVAEVADGRLRDASARATVPGARLTLAARGGAGRLPDEELVAHGRVHVAALAALSARAHGRARLRFAVAGNPARGLPSLSARATLSLFRLRLRGSAPLWLTLAATATHPERARGGAAIAATIADARVGYETKRRPSQRWAQRGRARIEAGSGRVALSDFTLVSRGQTISLWAALRRGQAGPHGRLVVALHDVTIPAPTVADASVPAIERGRVALTARPDRLAARLHLVTDGGGTLTGDASMPIRLSLAHPPSLAALRRHPLHATLRLSRFHTAWIAALLPEVQRMHGTVSGVLTVAGTAEKPLVAGQLWWRNGLIVQQPRPPPAGTPSRARGRAPPPSRRSADR